MSKNLLMALLLTLTVAPAGAAGISAAAIANDAANEAVDCFYEQNRYLPECKKK